MKNIKHGRGLNHHLVVRFSNRLIASSHRSNELFSNDFSDGFDAGWCAACKYYAHELRVALRNCESHDSEDEI